MTRPNPPETRPQPDLSVQLRWPLRLTWAALVAERGWRAFWPLMSLALLVIALSRFTVLDDLAFAGFGLAILVALIWGLSQFRPPTNGEVEARLDRQFPSRPLAALRDATTLGNDATRSIWQAHQARMWDQAKRARAEPPDLRIAARDPFALRLIALTAFVLSILFGQPPQTARPHPAPQEAGCPTCGNASWEGWIEPPAYTGQPSLYLNDQPPGPLPVPTGSRLTLRLYGTEQTPIEIESDLIDGPVRALIETDITRSGTLRIGHDGPIWRIIAIGDLPPEIRRDGEMTWQVSGDFQQGFLASDDHGVLRGTAQISLALDQIDRRHGLSLSPDPRPPLTLDLPRPYRGDLRVIEETWRENLATHPWAGLPVTVTFLATDGAGQQGRAAPFSLILPARRFFTPEARALIELRRDLLWARAGAPRVAQILRAILNRPEGLSLPDGTYLALRAVITDLERAIKQGLDAPQQDALAASLWDIALRIEEATANDARQRLEQAQKALEQALREGADPQELADLMEELRRATKDYLDRLAQSPEQSQPQSATGDDQTMEMSTADLDALMDRIEELMQDGRTDEAMQMLEALRQMMDNMQVTQGDGASQNQQAREGLTDTLRQQQGLSDEAFRDLQEQNGRSGQVGENEGNRGRNGGRGQGQSHAGDGENGEGAGDGKPGQQPGQGQNEPTGQDLATRQRALQGQLDAQRRALPGAGSEAGNAARDALGEAGRAMGEAAEALENGALAEALDHQAEALEALREGVRRFDEAANSDQAGREGQQGQTGRDQGRSQARDPLGRASGNQAGRGATDGGNVTERDLRQRAEELTEELRRRSGEADRSEKERGYLERLLEPF